MRQQVRRNHFVLKQLGRPALSHAVRCFVVAKEVRQVRAVQRRRDSADRSDPARPVDALVVVVEEPDLEQVLQISDRLRAQTVADQVHFVGLAPVRDPVQVRSRLAEVWIHASEIPRLVVVASVTFSDLLDAVDLFDDAAVVFAGVLFDFIDADDLLVKFTCTVMDT